MSWDDVEIKASDIVGDNKPQHPCQLVMSSESRVELPRDDRSSSVYCKHSTKIPLGVAFNPHYSIVSDYAIVPLNVYVINNIPVRVQTDYDTEGRLPLLHVAWAMGLCECGILYWKPVDVLYAHLYDPRKFGDRTP